jgi:hypothetical protein
MYSTNPFVLLLPPDPIHDVRLYDHVVPVVGLFGNSKLKFGTLTGAASRRLNRTANTATAAAMRFMGSWK